MTMTRDADAAIAELEAIGARIDPAVAQKFREAVAASEAAANPAPSKSTTKRVAAQKKSPRKRRS